MKVKELIIKLLEEDMNEEVFVATTDESRKDDTSTEKYNVSFDITEVKHWLYNVYIGFTDWRSDGCCSNHSGFEPQRMNVCDLCIYNPPSSADDKPCTMCPATTIEPQERSE